MSNLKPNISIIGGTGDLGRGLAWHLANVGYSITIGSRQAAKAESVAQEMQKNHPTCTISGTDNVSAANSSEIVILTVPYTSKQAILEFIRDSVQGKTVVDTTVPLRPPKVMRAHVPEGSAAKKTQEFLGDGVKVVSAFQNLAAEHLHRKNVLIDECEVLVCGNNPDARQQVIDLATDIGLHAWHAGPIENSCVAEGLTSILIFINKRYSLTGAGIRITSHTEHEA